ncbi:MAG: extracellular solute-binding protein [Ruminococcaceae bacterium]|nr:extracellular solute-binding protein [Oscillospiraceae bacterium]
MNTKKALSMLLAGTMAAGMLSGCGEKTGTDGIEEITFLTVWQGDSVMAPENPHDNMVLNKIMEETGVKINVEYNGVTEIERLNTMFAAGDFPDLVSCAMWGMDDTSTGIIKKAAREEMIMPLNDLLDQYGENIKASYGVGLSEDFVKFDLEDEAFGGNQYFIPAGGLPLDQRTEYNEGALFIREDIAKALNVDVNAVKTSDDVYKLMQQIAAAGFQDANGGPVIPGGVLHSGGGLGQYYTSYVDRTQGFCGLYMDENGKVGDDFFNPLLDKQTLHLRKLFAEELLDIEGLSQTAARAQEKIATGKYALVPTSWTNLQTWCADTLYVTNPEMKYIPLCSQTGLNGQTKTYKLGGNGGSQVLFIPRESKKAEAVIKVLNYLFSEEGTKLIQYGIEGESYQVCEDGTLEFIGEYANMNTKERYKYGIGSYVRLCGVQYPKKWNKPEALPEEQQAVRDFLAPDIEYHQGIRVSYLELSHPKVYDIRAVKSNSRMTEVKQKAYVAKTDEEALGYLNELRQQVLDAGIEELWKSVEDYMAAHPEENYLF